MKVEDNKLKKINILTCSFLFLQHTKFNVIKGLSLEQKIYCKMSPGAVSWDLLDQDDQICED